MKTNVLVLAAMLAASYVAAPRAADRETRQMMADIRMLQEQTQLIQNQIASLTEAVATAMATTVKTVNARVDAKAEEQAAATRKAFTDQMVTVNAIGNDVRTLREKLDDTTVRVGSLVQEVDALRKTVMQQSAARSAFDPALGPPDGATAAPTTAAVGTSPSQLWNTAHSDYIGAQYDLAVIGFQTYIKHFPGERADDAQVYICHSYFQSAKYQEAVDACDTAIRTYPTSDKLSEAYYRKGEAHRNLKQPDRAREAFEQLIKRFPDSYEATLGNQRLQDLKKP